MEAASFFEMLEPTCRIVCRLISHALYVKQLLNTKCLMSGQLIKLVVFSYVTDVLGWVDKEGLNLYECIT